MTGSTEAINNKDISDDSGVIEVGSRETDSQDGEIEQGDWGHENGTGVPMTNIGSKRNAIEGDSGRPGDDLV